MRKFVQRSFLTLALAAVPMLALSGAAQAALSMTISGKAPRGQKPSATAPEGIPLLKLSHAITSPRDTASGLATGRRQHGPLEVTFEINSVTPHLAKALVTGETFKDVVITSSGVSVRTGQQAKLFEVKLTNAQLSAFHLADAGDAPRPSVGGKMGTASGPLERVTVTFVYENITWTWLDGNITADDSWDGSRDRR